MSGHKWTPHNEVIPASLFRFKDGTFTGKFTELLDAGHNHYCTLITVRNEKTNGEVVFEFTGCDPAPKPYWWQRLNFRSIDKKHPDLKLVVLNQ